MNWCVKAWKKQSWMVWALFLGGCGPAVTWHSLALEPLPAFELPAQLSTQPLAEESPLTHPNLTIVGPRPQNGQAVAEGGWLGSEFPPSAWKYMQWNNTHPVPARQATSAHAPTLTWQGAQLAQAQSITRTASLKLTLLPNASYRVALGGNNAEQSFAELPAGPCHHHFGGTDYLLFQDMPRFVTGKQPQFWGWQASFEMEVLESQVDFLGSPCDLNLVQAFLGIIWKIDKQDPHTIFYQIHLSDSRPKMLNSFNHRAEQFAGMPLTCLLGRGSDQFTAWPEVTEHNAMIALGEKARYQLLLPLEQLAQDFRRCFPAIPPEAWFVESLYYGIELDGVSRAEVTFENFQFQTLWLGSTNRE